jgi:hypothetical protein
MTNHECSFFICQNQLKFCNNDKIINYNWIKLFNICNTLTESKTKYNIYLKYRSVRVERGPFIYVNNKMNEQVLKILSNSKENIKNEEKEYNKIMNDIYKFDVDS